jgi:hypothetical protein
MPPSIRPTIADNAPAVGQLLEDGYQPHLQPRPAARLMPSIRWARDDGDRLADGGPVTPAHGMVLDHLHYATTDTGTGELHYHHLDGELIGHTHEAGGVEHQHLPTESRPSVTA